MLIYNSVDFYNNIKLHCGIDFNIRKTQIVSFLPLSFKSRNDYILYNNERIEVVDGYKYLGVFIQKNLKWNKHINNVALKAQHVFGLLYSNFNAKSLTINDR